VKWRFASFTAFDPHLCLLQLDMNLLSENKASAKNRILEVFVSSPPTAVLSGIDTTTPTFAYEVERSEGHCRNIAIPLTFGLPTKRMNVE
jgi:hypothetical protein